MQIKVFSAPKMHEALALVREDFGSDAVILDRIEAVNAQGEKEWRVHAALDTELEDAVKKTAVAKPAVDEAVQANLEASMQRLEKIAASLGNRDVEQYRQAISKAHVQVAFDHLLAMGVSAINAFEMADAYAKHQPVTLGTLRWAKAFSAKQERRVVLFSGPNGAGKTLLAAKLATHYSLKGISVVLMTTDTQRIGGSEVLNAYAEVLGIPLFIIRNQEDAKQAHEATKTAQLVLIDSEGWNNRHASVLRSQIVLWDSLGCTHRTMVMPASLDEADGLAMLKRAQAMAMTQIAFTKLDETTRPGKIVNWAEASRMPMSYCSFGAEVPGQMGWLSPKALTAILVKHHKQQQEDFEEESIT